MSSVNKGTARERLTERIQAGKILLKLQKFIISKPTDEDYDNVQMTGPQVNAAKILLNKVAPDLKAIEQTIKDERKKTKSEVDDALTALGLDPQQVWEQITRH